MSGWIFSALAVFGFSLASQAKPVFLGELQAEFPRAPLSQRCDTCHVGGPRLNPFGKDFAKALFGHSNKTEMWQALRKMDSDKDGMSNEDEIEAGRAPGKAD